MKSFLFLFLLLGALALAQEEKCQCPQVRCAGDDAVALCQCVNDHETLCKERCPDYIPTYLPCPLRPPIPFPTRSPACICESTMCSMVWPESCYCQNEAKKKCWYKCGGAEPTFLLCEDPILSSSKSSVLPEFTKKSTKKSTIVKSSTKEPILSNSSLLPTSTKRLMTTRLPTKVPVATPTGSHDVCGGGRANSLTCKEGYVCIKDPFEPGCGPECDGLGICVEDKLCGGFAAFKCPEVGQACVDDPRDDCDPSNGGADCGGLCVWIH